MAPITRQTAARSSSINRSNSTSSTSKGRLSSILKASKSNGVTKGDRKESVKRKNLKAAIVKDPPTPTNAVLVAQLSSAATEQNGELSAILASPTATDAPLAVAPHENAVVSCTAEGEALAGVTIATGRSILEEAQAHIVAQAPNLAALVAKHTCELFTPAGLAEVVDPFQSLASGIISQQIAGAAARTIKGRFIALFEAELEAQGLTFPTPAMVLAVDQPTLRAVGLSGRKSEYIHSLAEAFVSGAVSSDLLATASEDEIVAELTKIRGIGVWSVEMFLMFGLRRMDVFSLGDLGIQRGMAAFAGKNVAALKTSGKGKWKYMNEADMKAMSEKFRPYRTLFCWYMWRLEGTEIDAMGDAKKTTKKATKKV